MAILFYIFSKKELPVGSPCKVIKHTEVCNTIISKKATPENLISRVALKMHFNSFLKLAIDIETSKISIHRTKSSVIKLYHFILLKSTPRIIAFATN